MRRGHDAHVDALAPAAAQAADLAALQGAQQLGLQLEGQLPHLVEEERAALGLLEEARPRALGAGEGPALVAEQLALDEVLGDRPAVEDDQRAPRPRGAGMQGPADQLLARSRLAGHQHAQLGGREPLQQAQDLAHRGALAVEAGVLVGRRGAHVDDLVGGLEEQLAVADAEAGAGAEEDLAHPHGADEGAVGRPEIAQQDALAGAGDLGVAAADRRVGEHHVALGQGADLHHIAADAPAPARVGPGLAAQRGPPDVDAPRGGAGQGLGDLAHRRPP